VLVEEAIEDAKARGLTISCSKGCGVCCSQLVPISHLEAWHIRDVIDRMPQEQRTAVEGRFVETRKRLEAWPQFERLLNPEKVEDTEARQLGLDYFRMGVPCPFLEDGACSIYPHRPAKCREYLVVSPPDCCASLTEGKILCVELPGRISHKLFHFESSPDAPFGHWIPLSLAPAWANSHNPPPPRPGPELLRELFERLAGKPLPDEDAAAANDPRRDE
jgi:Fe-S-cluster containining protein